MRRINKEILAYVLHVSNTDQNKKDGELKSLKYFGIGIDVVAKMDLWEIDYIAQVEAEYRVLFGE